MLETLCSVEITRLSRDEVRDLMMMMVKMMIMMMIVVEMMMMMVECGDSDGNDDYKITRLQDVHYHHYSHTQIVITFSISIFKSRSHLDGDLSWEKDSQAYFSWCLKKKNCNQS